MKKTARSRNPAVATFGLKSGDVVHVGWNRGTDGPGLAVQPKAGGVFMAWVVLTKAEAAGIADALRAACIEVIDGGKS